MANYEQTLVKAICQLQYEYLDDVKKDVLDALAEFPDLGHTEEFFVYEDGFKKKLLRLEGTIPINQEGSVFNIPISIWLSKRHPHRAPMVFVTPTSRMHIMSGNFVDMNGKVNLPYLTDWNYPSSDLLSLIQVLATIFTEEPPVRSTVLSQSSDTFQTSVAASIPVRDLQQYQNLDSTVGDFVYSGFYDGSDYLHGENRTAAISGAAGSVHGRRRQTAGGNISFELSDEVHGRTESGVGSDGEGLFTTERTGSSGRWNRTMSEQGSENEDVTCDTCRADNIVQEAEAFCASCKEYFCRDCLKYHRRMTATKNHKIFKIA